MVELKNKNTGLLESIAKSKEERKEIREWSFLFLGAAIGSGILILPLQAGKVTLLATLIAMIIAIPGVYIGNSLMVKMNATTPKCNSYDSSIEFHLGKKVGYVLSLIYILLIFTILVIVGTSATSNFAAVLQYYGHMNSSIASFPIYIGIFLAIVILPLLFGQNFLLSLIEKIVALKIVILLILILMFIPLWHSENMHRVLSLSTNNLGSGILEMLPVLIFGVGYFTAIATMMSSLQKKYGEANIKLLCGKGNRSNMIALVLVGVLMFLFIGSSLFALSISSLDFAAKNNLTALSVIAKNSSSGLFSQFSIFIGFFISLLAILTSVYAVSVGVIDSVASRLPKRAQNYKKIITIVIFFVLFIWIALNINILSFIIHVIAPLIVIFTFFLPAVAVYKSKKLAQFRGIFPILSIIIGVVVLIASLM